MSKSGLTSIPVSNAMPALPGLQKTVSQRGDEAIFQAKACSLPPPPTTSTLSCRTGATRPRTCTCYWSQGVSRGSIESSCKGESAGLGCYLARAVSCDAESASLRAVGATRVSRKQMFSCERIVPVMIRLSRGQSRAEVLSSADRRLHGFESSAPASRDAHAVNSFLDLLPLAHASRGMSAWRSLVQSNAQPQSKLVS